MIIIIIHFSLFPNLGILSSHLVILTIPHMAPVTHLVAEVLTFECDMNVAAEWRCPIWVDQLLVGWILENCQLGLLGKHRSTWISPALKLETHLHIWYWGFSIAMFDYQRVWNTTWRCFSVNQGMKRIHYTSCLCLTWLWRRISHHASLLWLSFYASNGILLATYPSSMTASHPSHPIPPELQICQPIGLIWSLSSTSSMPLVPLLGCTCCTAPRPGIFLAWFAENSCTIV